jgi:23S rRNA pseudouridine1911/1915/1917 synthase
MMATDAEQRLDLWLARERDITRHAARTLVDAGFVTVNGRLGRPGQRIHDHDVVLVSATADGQAEQVAGGEGASRSRAGAMEEKGGSGYAVGPPLEARRSALGSPSAPTKRRLASETPRHHPPPPSDDLDIVFEDDWLAVIDKPAGLVVHPAAGHADGTLADMLRARGTTWSLLGGAERPGIVHRLDRDTSGLLVVAKSEAAHRALAHQLRDRTLGRTYTAIVHGGFRETTGTIDAPLARDPRNRKRMAVVDSGRSAVTDFRVAERIGKLTVLEVQLRTGRTHQIRVHLAYIRHPVVGDVVYGKAEPGLPRLALHATRLTFVHPADGSTRSFESPLPGDIEAFLERTRSARS